MLELLQIGTSLSKGNKVQKVLQVIYHSIHSFYRDDCYTKAATLTFYTIQSIIPIFALVIGVAKWLGFEEYLESQITTTFNEQKEILNYIILFAHASLKQIRGGVFVVFGVMILIWSSLNMVNYIEITFDAIWKIKKSRKIYQRVKDFFVLIVCCPIVFALSSAIIFYVREDIANLKNYSSLQLLSSYVVLLFRFTPLVLMFLLFLIMYIVVPNTKLQWGPRLIAAALAACAFEIWQSLFIKLQVLLFNYSTVYGAFAILPLFLVWVQFSWLIALMCAELSATLENKHAQ